MKSFSEMSVKTSKPKKIIKKKVNVSQKKAREQESLDILKTHEQYRKKRISCLSESSDGEELDELRKIDSTGIISKPLSRSSSMATTIICGKTSFLSDFERSNQSGDLLGAERVLTSTMDFNEESIHSDGQFNNPERFLAIIDINRIPAVINNPNNRRYCKASAMQKYKRFMESENDKFHLGLNFYVHRDIWERLKKEEDSVFIKDLASIFWDTETLQKRCLDKNRLKAGRDSEERKELSPQKFKLLEDLLYKKLTETKCTGASRESKVKLVGHYMSEKIRDCRKK